MVDGYFARHRVKPGITGWAQINGWRGETDTHEKIQQRVEHDLYYIENWSVLFDLYILMRTPLRPAQVRERLLIDGARHRDDGAGAKRADFHRAAALPDAVAHRCERRDRVLRAKPLRGDVVSSLGVFIIGGLTSCRPD